MQQEKLRCLFQNQSKLLFREHARSYGFRDIVTWLFKCRNLEEKNIFQVNYRVHIGTLTIRLKTTFTDWTLKNEAKASICISEDNTQLNLYRLPLKISMMIEMDNNKKGGILQSLINKVGTRINEIK